MKNLVKFLHSSRNLHICVLCLSHFIQNNKQIGIVKNERQLRTFTTINFISATKVSWFLKESGLYEQKQYFLQITHKLFSPNAHNLLRHLLMFNCFSSNVFDTWTKEYCPLKQWILIVPSFQDWSQIQSLKINFNKIIELES